MKMKTIATDFTAFRTQDGSRSSYLNHKTYIYKNVYSDVRAKYIGDVGATTFSF